MKPLNERLEDRKEEYEKIIEAEHLAESYLKKILPLFPENTRCAGNIYSSNSFFYISVDSVEEFEENIISKLSEIFKIAWRRSVSENTIFHSTELAIDDGKYEIYLTVNSKPTDLCRIIAVPTGKIKKVRKEVTVDEAEMEFVIECSEETVND